MLAWEKLIESCALDMKYYVELLKEKWD